MACALFNALVYAPYLVLGPVVSAAHLGGGHSWGLIVAAQGAGWQGERPGHDVEPVDQIQGRQQPRLVGHDEGGPVRPQAVQ